MDDLKTPLMSPAAVNASHKLFDTRFFVSETKKRLYNRKYLPSVAILGNPDRPERISYDYFAQSESCAYVCAFEPYCAVFKAYFDVLSSF